MSVILVGYRGSGKTSIAQILAERKGWKFIDTDQEVTRVTGKTIKEIFDQQGELAFRQLEVAEVEKACKLKDAAVSLGGGAVLLGGGRHAIQASGHICVYLVCAVQELVRRIAADHRTIANRPFLTNHSLEEEVAITLTAREPKYRMVATRELDVTDLPIDAAAAQILEWL